MNLRKHPPKRAFTLVEIMVVVVIIGLLLSIALPAFKRVRMNTMMTEYMNDIRILSSAFDTYALENGSWPQTKGLGILPPEMTEYIRASDWAGPTPVGGKWRWIRSNWLNLSIIQIRMSGSMSDELKSVALMIDAKLDDGIKNQGKFRWGSTTFNFFLIRG